MTLISASHDALSRAETCLASMRTATNLAELREFWLQFLVALRRCWNKAEFQYLENPQWKPLHDRYFAEINTDELLKYLWHARNSDEHGIAELTTPKHGEMRIGGEGRFYGLRFGDGVFELNATPGISVTFSPATLMPIDVTDKSGTYSPPKAHLDKLLLSPSVLEIAGLGFEYYKKLVQQAEAILGGT